MDERLHPLEAREAKLAEQRPAEVPFEEHVELARSFLARRRDIVEDIQGALNAQRKPIQYLQDRALLARDIEHCFFRHVGQQQARVARQLEEAHWASGFKPSDVPGLFNDIVDPAEMSARAFHMWQQTRWPGRNGRVRYAQTLFDLSLIRRLAHLTMRIWDAGASRAPERLEQVQALLDELWRSAPSGHQVLLRDARWLIPVATSPTTDELWPYFDVAEHIADSLPRQDQVEIHKAAVRLAGGHLRSQLRYVSTKNGVPLHEKGLVLNTRKSNALDFAILIQGLVTLLEAYQQAAERGDDETRLELADAICQGVSADPELFLNRLDLLGPYSMIEYLFTTTDDAGNALYTPMGQRHVRLLEEYARRIVRSSAQLHEDCRHFRPVAGAYSPYGVLFGFSSNILEHMALKTLQPDAVTRFSLEDVFTAGDADKLDWVSGWWKLPHVDRQVEKLFEYPQQFAEDIFDRIERELGKRASNGDAGGVRTGRLYLSAGDTGPEADSRHDVDTESPGDAPTGPSSSETPEFPAGFTLSSDTQIVAAHKADLADQAQLLHDRREGYYLLSYETSGGWVAISKDLITEVLGAGRDLHLAGLPPALAGVVQLMCLGLAIPEQGLSASSGAATPQSD